MRITVGFPVGEGRLVLRTAHDWERDLEAVRSGPEGAEFDVDIGGSHLAMKPCLRLGDELRWARGADYVLSAWEPDPQIWPYFDGPEQGRITDRQVFEQGDHRHEVRVYLPPGYDGNPLRTYPVLYMQDGQNLFFPEEAFGGNEWQVDETMDRLDRMNAVRKVIVVGVRPQDRMRDYTRPGYEAYGRFLAGQIKPWVDGHFRTRPGATDTVVMGSSLGGVVSLYLAWQFPQVFGGAACLSSTFGYQDDLFERIAREPKPQVRVYLDSGWPRDNFDATNAMRDLLVTRGFRLGDDLLQWSFPQGKHNEGSWAERIHVPFQFFFGRAWSAQRQRAAG